MGTMAPKRGAELSAGSLGSAAGATQVLREKGSEAEWFVCGQEHPRLLDVPPAQLCTLKHSGGPPPLPGGPGQEGSWQDTDPNPAKPLAPEAGIRTGRLVACSLGPRGDPSSLLSLPLSSRTQGRGGSQQGVGDHDSGSRFPALEGSPAVWLWMGQPAGAPTRGPGVLFGTGQPAASSYLAPMRGQAQATRGWGELCRCCAGTAIHTASARKVLARPSRDGSLLDPR